MLVAAVVPLALSRFQGDRPPVDSWISRCFEVFVPKPSSLLPPFRRSFLILFFLKSFLKQAAIKPARKDFGKSPLFFLGGRGEADLPGRNRGV